LPSTTFYFDVGSPYAYLAAERADQVLPGPVQWQPVLLGGLFKLTGRGSWALGDYRRRQRGMAEIERRARGYGLPPIVWPDPWPGDYLAAMRVVTYAFAVGRGREVVARLFADGFARGRDLSIRAHILDAASRAGLERGEAEAATRDPAIKLALREATETAHALGVFGVPTVAVGDLASSAAPDGGALASSAAPDGGALASSAAPDGGGALASSAAPDGGALELFWGDDRLEDAAARLLSVGPAA
jgi:2-hydroxychromene-2-carboxylate isomerase